MGRKFVRQQDPVSQDAGNKRVQGMAENTAEVAHANFRHNTWEGYSWKCLYTDWHGQREDAGVSGGYNTLWLLLLQYEQEY